MTLLYFVSYVAMISVINRDLEKSSWDHDAVQKPGTREDHLNHRP
jgi:hypothetical protein